MIYVVTGNGKGKTTSALGMTLRAAGWEKKSAIVFFDKGGEHYGEQNILNLLQDKIESFRFGLPRFDEIKKTFRFENTEADKQEALRAVEKVFELLTKNYFMIVCDEILNCLNLELLEGVVVKNLIESCPPATYLVLTGRNVPDWIKEKADLISEVKMIKHPFQKGKQAEKGIEY